MVGEVGEVGEAGASATSCGGAWYLRLRRSTMKQVTAENAKRCEYVARKKKMERLTA